ncbi:methyltransferase [Nocardiopsis kunsanensis]|uniref:Methyltransferase n=1 Tax=Nocardiopsis kunsanensis TaxID=141693 RepID=A0A918XIM8_9ACTN|nr:methyltransferase [Nocardiopsis kunsanensis]GHD33836.1 methyltransferase [Nocardiopsis kunsanensis]
MGTGNTHDRGAGKDEPQLREEAARLWRKAALVTPLAIRAVATLRIADHLVDRARTAEELGEAVGADPEALGRVMRHLVNEDIFTMEDGRFGLTGTGSALRTNHPWSRLGWLSAEGAIGRSEVSLTELASALRTGETAYARYFRSTFWKDLSADPALAASFDHLMGARMIEHARTLTGMYGWDSLKDIVDVGGGDGTLLSVLLGRFPGLRGTVLDLEGPVRTAWETFRYAGLDERADAVAGSFFDPLPPGRDAYLLCWVLHDWDDESALAILRRCAEAADPTGRVLVAEYGGGKQVTELDVRMLAYFNGRERDVAALSDLAAEAGLSLAGEHSMYGITLTEFTVGRPE